MKKTTKFLLGLSIVLLIFSFFSPVRNFSFALSDGSDCVNVEYNSSACGGGCSVIGTTYPYCVDQKNGKFKCCKCVHIAGSVASTTICGTSHTVGLYDSTSRCPAYSCCYVTRRYNCADGTYEDSTGLRYNNACPANQCLGNKCTASGGECIKTACGTSNPKRSTGYCTVSAADGGTLNGSSAFTLSTLHCCATTTSTTSTTSTTTTTKSGTSSTSSTSTTKFSSGPPYFCSRCSDTYKGFIAHWKQTSACPTGNNPRSDVVANSTYYVPDETDCGSITGTPPSGSVVCGANQYTGSDCNGVCLSSGSCKQIENNTTQYHCCYTVAVEGTSSSCTRCSDTYKYLHADWSSSIYCDDTKSAVYKIDCSCKGGNTPKKPDDYASIDCSTDAAAKSTSGAYNCTEASTNHILYDTDGKTKITTPAALETALQKACITTAIPDCTDYSDDYLTNCSVCDSGNDTDGKCINNGTKTCTKTIYHKGKTDEATQCNPVNDHTIACNDPNCSSSQTCNQTTGNCDNNTTTTTSAGSTTTVFTTTTTSAGSTTTSSSTTTTTAAHTYLAFVLGLDGIGAVGDEPNPSDQNCTAAQRTAGCGSNQNPLRTSRDLAIEIFDSSSTSVAQKSGTIAYDSNTGLYTGSVNLGAFTTDTYSVKAKSPGYLRRLVSGSQTITSGTTNNAPQSRFITGNVNQDNYINIADYNIFLSCSTLGTDNGGACSADSSYKTLSDLDDNGVINNYDYNLFMRDLKVGQGD
jgi:hypothetical protein